MQTILENNLLEDKAVVQNVQILAKFNDRYKKINKCSTIIFNILIK